MRKSAMKWMAIAILCFVNVTSLQACLNKNGTYGVIDLVQKFYVKLHQVNFSNDKIYIAVEDLIYETPSILSDENGYYIEKIALAGSCSWYEWKCNNPRCGACNLKGIDLRCRACKYPQPFN